MPSVEATRQFFRFGGIAQLGERLHGMQEVSGSIPLISTKLSSQKFDLKTFQMWGYSSAGRALAWHARGQRFDPAYLHQIKFLRLLSSSGFAYWIFLHLKILPFCCVAHCTARHARCTVLQGLKPKLRFDLLAIAETAQPEWMCINRWRAV